MTTSNIIYLTGELTDAVLKEFLQDYNKCDFTRPITIYLNTCGGFISVSNILIDIINYNADRIHLIASGEIYSAGFDVFFFSKCKRSILPYCTGMTHYMSAYVKFGESGSQNSEDRLIISEMKKNKNSTFIQLEEIGLTKKELSLVRRGKDCYFSHDRLVELLNYKHGEKNES